MRKFILILTVAVMAAVVFNGCKKDNKTQPVKQEVSAKDNAITMRILNFEEKLSSYENNDGLKGHEAITIDSAVWYTEALLNYTYDESITNIESFLTVSDSLQIPTANGLISYNDLHYAFVKMNNIVKKHKENNPDAKLFLIDICKKSINNSEVRFIIVTGFSQSNKIDKSKEYYEYDEAAEMIQYNINSNISQPSGEGYWTDVDVVHSFYFQYNINNGQTISHNFYNPDWDEQYVNYYRYLMFYNVSNEPSFHIYLDDTEISNYTSLTYYLISDYIPDNILDYLFTPKSLISCDLYGEYIYLQYPQVTDHQVYSYYGVWVPTGGGGGGKN